MQNQITVIITIRNRESSRIENQVNSIRKYGANPTIHVVDYGSDENYKNQYEKLCAKLNIKFTHMYAEGLPWNKCRAINYGVRQATTPFIVTSDVDMIYTSNPFQWCLDNFEEKCIYHIPTYWLPKSANFKKAQAAGIGNSGGFVFSHIQAFIDTNGYDERFVYWGKEDADFPIRLRTLGYKQIWLPETEHKLYHQWHPTLKDTVYRPTTAFHNSFRFNFENLITPKINQNYGENLELKDRPILNYINKKNIFPEEYVFHKNKVHCDDNAKDFISFIKSNSFIKLDLSNRNMKKNKQSSYFMKKVFNHLLKKFGYTVTYYTNTNFDFLYEVLPILLKKKLIDDYYISNDLKYIYLLKTKI